MKSSGLCWISGLFSGLSDLAFPPVCACCLSGISSRKVIVPHLPDPARIQHSRDLRCRKGLASLEERFFQQSTFNLCGPCMLDLRPTYSQKCLQCGAGQTLPTAASITDPTTWIERCEQCRRSGFGFSRCYSLGNYELGLREAVLKIKAGTHDGLIHELAKLLAAQISCDAEIDRVLPVPTHWKRRLFRRTVVSEVLSEKVSKQIGSKHCGKVLRVQRATKKQGTLSTTDRIQNVKGSFHVAKPNLIRGSNLLVVDDVMTSGATLNEIARTCLAAGASSISVAVVARGVGRSLNR